MPRFTLYAKKIHYFRKEIEAKDEKAAQQRAERYETGECTCQNSSMNGQ